MNPRRCQNCPFGLVKQVVEAADSNSTPTSDIIQPRNIANTKWQVNMQKWAVIVVFLFSVIVQITSCVEDFQFLGETFVERKETFNISEHVGENNKKTTSRREEYDGKVLMSLMKESQIVEVPIFQALKDQTVMNMMPFLSHQHPHRFQISNNTRNGWRKKTEDLQLLHLKKTVKEIQSLFIKLIQSNMTIRNSSKQITPFPCTKKKNFALLVPKVISDNKTFPNLENLSFFNFFFDPINCKITNFVSTNSSKSTISTKLLLSKNLKCGNFEDLTLLLLEEDNVNVEDLFVNNNSSPDSTFDLYISYHLLDSMISHINYHSNTSFTSFLRKTSINNGGDDSLDNNAKNNNINYSDKCKYINITFYQLIDKEKSISIYNLDSFNNLSFVNKYFNNNFNGYLSPTNKEHVKNILSEKTSSLGINTNNEQISNIINNVKSRQTSRNNSLNKCHSSKNLNNITTTVLPRKKFMRNLPEQKVQPLRQKRKKSLEWAREPVENGNYSLDRKGLYKNRKRVNRAEHEGPESKSLSRTKRKSKFPLINFNLSIHLLCCLNLQCIAFRKTDGYFIKFYVNNNYF